MDDRPALGPSPPHTASRSQQRFELVKRGYGQDRTRQLAQPGFLPDRLDTRTDPVAA